MTADGPRHYLSVSDLSREELRNILTRADEIKSLLRARDRPSLFRGLVLAMGLRYIPTFSSLFGVVRDAQQSRGLDLSEGRWLARLRAHLPILVAMIISALRTAEKLGMALEARALGLPGVRRTAFREIAFRPVDYAFLALVLANVF